MHTTALSQNWPAWTWADLLSTYRFWGLFLWFVLTAAGMQYHQLFSFFRLTDVMGFTPRLVGTILSVAQGGGLLVALILAWAAIRTRPVLILLITGGLAALAAFAVAAGWPRGLAATVAMLFCLNTGSYVVTLLFPTLVAGALGGYEAFFVAFGVSFLFQYEIGGAMTPLYVSLGASTSVNATTSAWPAYISAGLLLVAVICLIPVKHALFTVEPPPRGRSFAPRYREAFLTALLTAIVPFYVLYWLYQAHGEAAHLRPSRALLSPRGAVWIAVVVVMFPNMLTILAAALLSAQGDEAWGIAAVPLLALVMYSIMLTTLADHLNLRATELGLPRVCRPWAVFLWTMLFAPVAVEVLQSGLNGLAHRTAQSAPAPAA
ncbi:MAG TPA: hypothetical protein VEH50_13255 [Methylomirabilota bacterium]|nr:hypothetical protein [Methylomirabilota bacterium]